MPTMSDHAVKLTKWANIWFKPIFHYFCVAANVRFRRNQLRYVMTLPSNITHYFSRSDSPFLNLSDLGEDEADIVIKNLARRRSENLSYKRVFGKVYMDFRRRTEAKLRKIFENNGGQPERQAPHYFLLGECEWFADLYPDTKGITLDWRSLPREIASFTYPDSAVSMRLGSDYGLPTDPFEPYHERVFFLDELEGTVAEYGLPDGSADANYEGYHKRKFEKYIEVQVWSDAPVAKYLKPESQ